MNEKELKAELLRIDNALTHSLNRVDKICVLPALQGTASDIKKAMREVVEIAKAQLQGQPHQRRPAPKPKISIS